MVGREVEENWFLKERKGNDIERVRIEVYDSKVKVETEYFVIQFEEWEGEREGEEDYWEID